MKTEVQKFENMIFKYKNELARLYGRAKMDFEKVSQFGR